MALYTKCPACRSEIAFDPPANIADLPESYRHRIKCPSCGVTIGVKLNTIARQPVEETPLAIQSVDANRQYEQPQLDQEQETESVPARDLEKPKKKPGTGRNIMMMIISLLFVAINVVAYLIKKGVIPLPLDSVSGTDDFPFNLVTCFGLVSFDGISVWEFMVKDFASFKLLVGADALMGFLYMLPMLIFTMSCITFIVAFISACGKKYGRAFNVIWALIIFGFSLTLIFSDYIYLFKEDGVALKEYFLWMFRENFAYAALAPAVFGFLQTFFSLIFIKSLEIKPKN